jgi:hypothetical protein
MDAQAIAATLRAAFADFESLYTPGAFRATTPTADRIIVRTTDGGENWLPEASPATAYDLSRISCTGFRNGTVVGYGGTILRRAPTR